MRCKATTTEGAPCGVPEQAVDPSTGYCYQHDPSRQGERERARWKGIRKAAEKARRLRERGLDDEDLPPLTSHAAAEVWTDRIGRAAARGAIGASAANAALRAVREWREAHEAGAVADQLQGLLDALAEWRETGDPEPIRRLVDGGSKS